MPRRPLFLALCNAGLAGNVALAACAFALPASITGDEVEMQLTPAGRFAPSDGRKLSVPGWNIDQAIATKVIAAYATRKTPAVLDYEHQTLRKEDNGQPAPAAGWIRSLNWKEGSGLFATVSLTARAKKYIADGEYQFISPVFTYDAKTGDVSAIQMAALTNTPAIDGMEQVQLRAAATFGHSSSQENSTMNKLLVAIIAGLSLAAATTEDEAIAALSAIKPKLDERDKLRLALGIESTVASTDAITACTAIKTKADAGTTVDPSKYVPVSVVEELKTQVAALSAKQNGKEVAELVALGLKDGRLLAAQKDWATDLGNKDIAALTKYLETTPAIAALNRTQTEGRPPRCDNAEGLSDEELAICSQTGVSPEDFKKAKPKAA